MSLVLKMMGGYTAHNLNKKVAIPPLWPLTTEA